MKKHLLRIMTALAFAILLIITGCEADPVSVSSISLNKTELNLALGSAEKLTATTSPSDATVGTGITWSSDKAEIASVDKEGNVTAKALGEATVTATTDNGIKATCKITVKPIIATSIKLSAETLSLEKEGTADLTVIFTPANTTDNTITWESSVPAVATVENGKITALTIGETIITAKTSNGMEASCTVHVTPILVEKLEIALPKIVIEKGKVTELPEVIFTPTNTTDKSLTFSVENTDIAKIENENILGIATGKTILTATSGTKSVTIPIYVVDYIITESMTVGHLPDRNVTELTLGGTCTKNDLMILRDYFPQLVTLDLRATDTTEIGDQAFYTDNHLKTIYMPEGLTRIGKFAFMSSAIENVILAESGLTTIDQQAFYQSSLKSINLPETLDSINHYAFQESQLAKITIPSSVNTYGYDTFAYCPNLKEVTFAEGSKVTGYEMFQSSPITKVTMPNSMTSIEARTFANCSKLTSINIPDNVSVIGGQAFMGCYELSEVHLPINLTTIKEHTFGNCFKLTKINLHDNIEVIEECAFRDTALQFDDNTLRMPKNLKTVGKEAFKFVYPSNPENTENEIVTNVTKIELNKGLETIDMKAFLFVRNIEEITIPSTVKKMTDSWWMDYKTIVFLGEVPPEVIYTTDDTPKPMCPNNTWMETCNVYIPKTAEEAYKNSVWLKGSNYYNEASSGTPYQDFFKNAPLHYGIPEK